MDAGTALWAIALLVCALLLTLLAAVEAAGLLAPRGGHRPALPLGSSLPDALQQFAERRDRVIAAIGLAKILSLIVPVAGVFVLLERASRSGAKAALASALLIAVAAAFIEAVPRLVVSRDPERWYRILLPAELAIVTVMLPFAYLSDRPGHLLLRLPMFRQVPAKRNDPTEGELVRLVEMEASQGGIEQEEREMIRAVFELEQTTAREIMVPRIDITALPGSASLQEAAEVIAAKGFSRIPLYDGNLDNVAGVIYAKDLLASFARGERERDLHTLLRTPLFVPETKRLDQLLSELRDRRIHIAIVVDEYGGTAGLLTIEDLVEEIVGEIEDEYDRSEPAVQARDDGGFVVDARQSVDLLKELFDIEVDAADFDSIGGLIIHALGRMPVPNDVVEVDGVRLQVLSMAGRRLRQVLLSRDPGAHPTDGQSA